MQSKENCQIVQANEKERFLRKKIFRRNNEKRLIKKRGRGIIWLFGSWKNKKKRRKTMDDFKIRGGDVTIPESITSIAESAVKTYED